jgi:hypothetical protein
MDDEIGVSGYEVLVVGKPDEVMCLQSSSKESRQDI